MSVVFPQYSMLKDLREGQMKAGTRVELPLWLGEMLAVAGG